MALGKSYLDDLSGLRISGNNVQQGYGSLIAIVPSKLSLTDVAWSSE